ncbi:MAG: alkaline phosphatase [Planctomycetaceae bacterium]|jgi:alkaline phosphatase|nr:alkaline phosphatase [Planctomycetaceae bacterium]
MKQTRKILTISTSTLFALIFLAAVFSPSVHAQGEPAPKKAKNIILMIGDGMGFNQHVAGAYWRVGEPGKMPYENFPFHAACTTFSSKGKPVSYHYEGYVPDQQWGKPETAAAPTELTQITDSAAGITALQSGVKTKNSYLGVDTDKNPLKLVAETAQEAGKSTGAVTTAVSPHATPGGVLAHNVSRDNYVEIFNEQTGKNGLTVLMGGGHPYYDSKGNKKEESGYDFKKVGGEETWEAVISENGHNGYTFIDTAREFSRLAQSAENLPEKVLGIVRNGDDVPPVDGTPSEAPDSDGIGEKVLKDFQLREIPTLSTMSLAALNVLSQNPKGFYLMIEGGCIDHACHANDKERLVYEQAAFTKTIDAVVNWVEENSSWDETVLLITADHETGFLWGPDTFTNKDDNARYDSKKDEFTGYQPVVNNGCGKLPGMQFLTGGHSNSLVPVWGIGAGVEELEKACYGTDEKAAQMWNFSGKYLDNTDIALFLKSKIAP